MVLVISLLLLKRTSLLLLAMYDIAAAKRVPARSAYKLKNLAGTKPYIIRFAIGQNVREVANPALHFS